MRKKERGERERERGGGGGEGERMEDGKGDGGEGGSAVERLTLRHADNQIHRQTDKNIQTDRKTTFGLFSS